MAKMSKAKLRKKKLTGRKMRSGCAARDRFLRENLGVNQFIKAIAQKKYNTANKYLTDVIEAKLKARIAASL